jgi:hypothetical protein
MAPASEPGPKIASQHESEAMKCSQCQSLNVLKCGGWLICNDCHAQEWIGDEGGYSNTYTVGSGQEANE